jgi:sulfur carrier protein
MAHIMEPSRTSLPRAAGQADSVSNEALHARWWSGQDLVRLSPMTIRLNGEPHELAGPLTIAALLTALDIDARRVAVEHNLIVIKRTAYESTLVNEGDEVEIVNFVGGG